MRYLLRWDEIGWTLSYKHFNDLPEWHGVAWLEAFHFFVDIDSMGKFDGMASIFDSTFPNHPQRTQL